MNRQKIAQELVAVAKELTAADTFKCPDCGAKVLEQTGYCVKCKKKVKKASLDKALSDTLGDIIRNMGTAWEMLSDAESDMNYFTRQAKGAVPDDSLRVVSKVKMDVQQLLKGIADNRHKLTREVLLRR